MSQRKGLIAWFARNSVAANLLMVLIIVAGIQAAWTLRKQVFPEIEVNTITVQVAYPGASPLEVEEGINIKIEQAIEDVDGMKKVRSVAAENQGTVTIEVEDDFDVLEVLDEVKMRVDAIYSFPDEAEKPLIYRNKPDRQVIWLAVYGDLDEHTMKAQAERFRDQVVTLPGITKAEVIGARDYEISVEVSEFTLRKFGLSFEQVANAIRGSSLDLPGGVLRTEGGDIQLRTKGQAYTGEQFANILLLSRPDGTRLYLGDVATINDGFVDESSYSHFDGKPSIGIMVSAVGDQNELAMAQRVKQFVAEQQANLIPGAKLAYWADSSYYLQDRLDLMLRNMLAGAVLVFVLLSLFLRFSLAFWVMMGLPVCFLGALALMSWPAIGLSINMLSLFGFILVLGIVVDDAIVISESAYSEIERNGYSLNAIIDGANRVAMPATFGVLTTIAAFLPMILVGGTYGILWQTVGSVVILCLVFSLIESKWILPAHLRHMRAQSSAQTSRWPFVRAVSRFQTRFAEALHTFIHGRYRRALLWALRWRYSVLTGGLGVLMISLALVVFGYVRWVFFPDIPSDYMQASVAMKPGSSTEQLDKAMASIERSIMSLQQQLQQETGESIVRHIASFTEGKLSGEVWVELSKGEQRETDGQRIARRWRENTPAIAGARQLQFNGSTAAGGGADIAFQLSSVDLGQLDAAAKALEKELTRYNGVYDVRDSFSSGSQEVKLRLKPAGEALGLTREMLASQVRYGFYGAEAQRVQRGEEELKVMVRYPRDERMSLGDLENMRIRLTDGTEVPFTQVAEYDLGEGYSNITRINGVRAIDVEATVDKSTAEPSKIQQDIEQHFMPQLTATYAKVHYGLEGAGLEERNAMVGLQRAAVVAVLVIYALMAIPLRSYAQPLIIMSVIPFGFIGAVFGHWLMGLSISVMSLCGIVALAGVVVNDSLIMVDFVNRARERGATITAAAVEAGTQRFRAIVLTSLTTFFGLVPICLERSLQAKMVIPMAVSLAFGILFSTVVTLFLVPCLYLILNDIRQWLFGRKNYSVDS